MGLNHSIDLRRKYLLLLRTASFVEVILYIEYRITQFLARIKEDVFKRPIYSGKFLMRLY